MFATAPDPDFCGCDAPLAGRRSARLVSLDAALRRGLALAEPVAEIERAPLEDCAGRVLAVSPAAPIPLPPFDNSAMDGYALRVSDLAGEGPWTLPVAGRVAAGEPGAAPPPRGAALRILTGAPVPAGLDAVVMQERAERDGDAIRLAERPRPGLNIRRAGEDLPEGGRILPEGVKIGAREAAALAAVGLAEVPVRRRLRVAMFCTGSELSQPGEPLGPGRIWNSNRFMLRAALSEAWVETTDLGAVPDRPEALTEALAQAARGADIVVSTGGVSVGDEDHMPRVFRAAGGDIHAMRIAMKPGKPLMLGTMGDAIYLGLPGNPVAAFVAWHLIGARIARKRAGLTRTAPPRFLVRSGFALSRAPGRCEFRPARIVGRDGRGTPVIEPCTPSFSARIAALAAADGLALLPAEADEIAHGDLIDFIPLD